MTKIVELAPTPQQAMAFAWRGFDEPIVQDLGRGYFHAYAIRQTDRGPEWAEFLARRPEIAVEQLARLVARA